MIHTSDGESFEDEVGHVFGHDMMQTADTYKMQLPKVKPANDNLPFILSPPLQPHDWEDPHGDPFTQMPKLGGDVIPLPKKPSKTSSAKSEEGTQVAENKGPIDYPATEGWQSILKDESSAKDIDKALERGDTIMKSGPALDKYLKDNPDIEYYQMQNAPGHMYLKQSPKAPLVGSDPIQEELDKQGMRRQIEYNLSPDNPEKSPAWNLIGKVPVGELSSEPSDNIVYASKHEQPLTAKEQNELNKAFWDKSHDPMDLINPLSKDLGIQEIAPRTLKIILSRTKEIEAKNKQLEDLARKRSDLK